MTGPLDDRHSSDSTTIRPEPSLFDALTPLVRRWRLVVGLPLGAGVVFSVIALLLPPTYTATTTFAPAVSGATSSLPSGLGGLAGLATQFGVNIGSAGSISPDFFAEVLSSRELLRATLLSEFDDPERSGSRRPLLDLLKARGTTEELRMDRGIRRLGGATSQRVDRRTGIITLSVNARWPELAAAVANRMVELLNNFNLERLQSQSRARRRFAETRKAQAAEELRAAEADQLKFIQANRRYSDSPLLSFEQNRLARQVQLRQEVFQTLTREYEEARIAEVRDTPLLTTIDPAIPPQRRGSPSRTLIVLLAMVAAGFTALVLAYLDEYHRTAQIEDGSQYRRFVEAWTKATAELRAMVGLRKPR